MPTAIRVDLLEDHEVVRRGVAELLDSGPVLEEVRGNDVLAKLGMHRRTEVAALAARLDERRREHER